MSTSFIIPPEYSVFDESKSWWEMRAGRVVVDGIKAACCSVAPVLVSGKTYD
jgi:hypothetical protein